MSELIIRLIAKDDVFACLSIYNYEVEYGVATLDLEPRTLEEGMSGITRTAMSITLSL